MFSIKRILYAMAAATKDICDRSFYLDRPASLDERINSFIVYDVDMIFHNNEIDDKGGYDYFTSDVNFVVYVRDMQRGANPFLLDVSTLDEKITSIMERLPIIDENRDIKIYRPRLMLHGSDESGFHYAVIEAKISTNI